MSASNLGRQSRSIVIRRDDHIGDPIGLVFLDSPETDGDAVLERLREYLGRRLKLIKAEVSRSEITVEIESRGWREEGARLAAAARDLYNKGARRNAQSMYREALELDPMSADAIMGIGLALTDQGKFSDALATLKRARDFGANGIELLLAMGHCATSLDRSASAIVYYEQALKIAPRNFVARRALRALGRNAPPAGRKSGAIRTATD